MRLQGDNRNYKDVCIDNSILHLNTQKSTYTRFREFPTPKLLRQSLEEYAALNRETDRDENYQPTPCPPTKTQYLNMVKDRDFTQVDAKAKQVMVCEIVLYVYGLNGDYREIVYLSKIAMHLFGHIPLCSLFQMFV